MNSTERAMFNDGSGFANRQEISDVNRLPLLRQEAGMPGGARVNSEIDYLAAYLEEITKIPLLKKQEERVLGRSLLKGRVASVALSHASRLEFLSPLQKQRIQKALDIGADMNLRQDVDPIEGREEERIPKMFEGIDDKKVLDVDDLVAFYSKTFLDQLQLASEIENTKIRKKALDFLVDNEIEWIRSAENAFEKLVSANLRLVVSVAKNYMGYGMELLDLIQEGNIGLLRSINKFDYRRGYKFSTYSTWWIRQQVSRSLMDKSRTIRLPSHMSSHLRAIGRIRESLFNNLGREPTSDEVLEEAKSRGINIKKGYYEARKANKTYSLEVMVGEDEDTELGSLVRDEAVDVEESGLHSLLKEQIAMVLGTLSPKERKVLCLRFGLEDGKSRTLEEVGREFQVTRERIRQIESKALRKMRYPSRAKRLREYL